MKQFLKEMPIHIATILMISLLSLVIVKNLIFGIISSIINLSISIFILYLYYKKEQKSDEEISCKRFLSSLFSLIETDHSFSNAYSYSSRYLLGYKDILPEEEFIEKGAAINLYGYEPYLKKLIDDHKESIEHIYDYHNLINQLEEEIFLQEKKLSRSKVDLKNSLLFISFFMILITSFFFFFKGLGEVLSNNIYYILSAVITSFITPIALFINYTNIKEDR